jgi:hypothetical protein
MRRTSSAARFWKAQPLFLDGPQDIHFNAAGHVLWASWLREHLAAAAPPG